MTGMNHVIPLMGRPTGPCEHPRYVELGRGQRALVFLHGLFGDADHWREIMTPLSDRYRLIAPRLPIDQRPDRRRRGVRTVAEITDYVERCIADLGLDRPVICGNSLGGLVGIDYCRRHPGRVAGLVLAGSAGLYENSLTGGKRPQATRDFGRRQASQIFHDPAMVTDELVEEWYRAFQDRDFVRFVLRLSRATRDRRADDDLGKLDLPTLIVWGRNDKVTPPDVAVEFRDRIPGARLEFIDRCGHSPNLERPAEFARLLGDFLPECFERESQATRLLPASG